MTEEIYHYLKKKASPFGKRLFEAWCDEGDSRHLDDIGVHELYTYNINNVNCDACIEAAALWELAKVP